MVLKTDQSIFPLDINNYLAIEGESSFFPIHRVFCIGKNYQDHVAEMNYVKVDKSQTEPIYFFKSLVHMVQQKSQGPLQISFPKGTNNLHHEVELVVALDKDVPSDVTVDNAMDYVYGYAIGLDMTKRDLQEIAKSKGQPWDGVKNFENSGIVSLITPKSKFTSSNDINAVGISLSVNEHIKQDGNTKDLIWSIAEIIVFLTKYYNLKAGDIVFTGTPAGVGPVLKGDRLHAKVSGLQDLIVEYI